MVKQLLFASVAFAACSALDPKVLYLCESNGSCAQEQHACWSDGYCHPLSEGAEPKDGGAGGGSAGGGNAGGGNAGGGNAGGGNAGGGSGGSTVDGGFDAGVADSGIDAGPLDAGCVQGWCAEAVDLQGRSLSGACQYQDDSIRVTFANGEARPTGQGTRVRYLELLNDGTFASVPVDVGVADAGLQGCFNGSSFTWLYGGTLQLFPVSAAPPAFVARNQLPTPIFGGTAASGLDAYLVRAGAITRITGAMSGGTFTDWAYDASVDVALTAAVVEDTDVRFFGTRGKALRTQFGQGVGDGGVVPCQGRCDAGLTGLVEDAPLGTNDLLAAGQLAERRALHVAVVGRGGAFFDSTDGGFTSRSLDGGPDFTAVWVAPSGPVFVVGQTDAGSEVWQRTSTWVRVFTSSTRVRGVAGFENDAGTNVWLVGDNGLFLRRTF